MLTQDELAQYQQEADEEAALTLQERGKKLRRVAVSLLAMAATLTGVASGGTTSDPLDAPTLTWDGETLDLLPDFGLSYEAEIGDIITLRRSTTSNFASYEDAQDTVDSLVQTLDFDFGGDWDSGTWYVKCFYTRSGEDSPASDTVTVTIENDFLDARFSSDRLIIRDSATAANAYDGTPQGKLTATVDADGTFINASGVITQATANTLRIDHDPSTLECKGLLVEETRTNLFLNSKIDGTSLSTQGVSVTAQAYTLSFYGTGTITLTGASTAGPLVGTGAYPNRVTLTFTPSAGTLTCTVSGTVQYAQIEAGSFATSFIPTAGSTVTRTGDAITLAVSAFKFSTTASTLLGTATFGGTGSGGLTRIVQIDDGDETDRIILGVTSTLMRGLVVTASSSVFDTTQAVVSTGNCAMGVEANNFAFSANGQAVSTDVSGALPTGIATLRFGSLSTSTTGAVRIARFTYLARRASNTELVTLST